MNAGGEGLHRKDTGLKLIPTQDDDGAGGFVGSIEGFLQAKTALAELDPEPLVAQFSRQNQGGRVQSFAQRRNQCVRLWLGGRFESL